MYKLRVASGIKYMDDGEPYSDCTVYILGTLDELQKFMFLMDEYGMTLAIEKMSEGGSNAEQTA